MKKILFLCTGNSCRSQMGEALFNHFRHEDGVAFSAGIEKHGLNPYMLEVLKEIEVDTSQLYSKTVDELVVDKFDQVVTVCGHAHDNCPCFNSAAKIVHKGFDDPPFLAKGLKNKDEILTIFRRVRDEIKTYILNIQV